MQTQSIKYIVTYIGLPDMQDRDVVVHAENEYSAHDKADAILLRTYGRDDFDCLTVIPLISFHHN